MAERHVCALRLSSTYLTPRFVSDSCAEKSDSGDLEAWPWLSPAFEMLN